MSIVVRRAEIFAKYCKLLQRPGSCAQLKISDRLGLRLLKFLYSGEILISCNLEKAAIEMKDDQDYNFEIDLEKLENKLKICSDGPNPICLGIKENSIQISNFNKESAIMINSGSITVAKPECPIMEFNTKCICPRDYCKLKINCTHLVSLHSKLNWSLIPDVSLTFITDFLSIEEKKEGCIFKILRSDIKNTSKSTDSKEMKISGRSFDLLGSISSISEEVEIMIPEEKDDLPLIFTFKIFEKEATIFCIIASIEDEGTEDH